MQRRHGNGSMAAYAGTDWDFTAQPASGGKVLTEHGHKVIAPIIAVKPQGNLADAAAGAKIPSDFNTANLNKIVDAYAAEATTTPHGSCQASCSGLCVSGCYSGCSGCTGCSGSCHGDCVNFCFGDCLSGCGKNCGTQCTAMCTSCQNTCEGNCSKVCVHSCFGTCVNSCFGACVHVASA